MQSQIWFAMDVARSQSRPLEVYGGDLFRCGHLTADNDDDEEELNKINQAKFDQ